TAHGSYYDANDLRGQHPVTAYARVFRAGDGRVAIQYWLFYYFNDWYNKHEGDWEMIQVELDQTGQPARAVYAQHHQGTRRPWNAVGKIDGSHPRVYVALGSHASYFAGDTLYPQGVDVGAQRIEVYDRTGSADPITPAIQLISDGDPAWLVFAGRWGERAAGDFSGPTGPARKQAQWSDPFAWGDARPSDAATWYHRNVRLEIDAPPDQADLRLLNSIDAEAIVEDDRRRQTIVVPDKPQASDDELRLLARRAVSPTLIVEWPDTGAGNVTRREYDLAFAAGDLATTRLCHTCDFVLGLDTDGDGTSDRSVGPARRSLHKVNFNPPDSVVFYLPLDQIAGGLLIALAAAIVPSLAYALGVWWLDRYEKEPVHLLASVFVWGAIPGALVAVVARFFVAGAVAPILTETVKAAAILFVFTRYRREFDNVLDGIVYGAMTGVGYAMLINLLTYALSFLFGGFELLSASVLLDGVAFGLNEAYYAAVTGVGFGVSRWAADRRVRIGAPIAGLAFAISLHLFTDFWRDLAVGDRTWLVIVPFLATWAGILAILAIAFLALRREQETIRAHLRAEVERGTFTPNESFYLATPSRRAFMLLSEVRRGPVALARAVKLLDLATHLAFRRRELALINGDPDADAPVIDLRRRIAEIRPKLQPRRRN
ncbi:MAG TPA: PrsW family intramembrane metalloprotease, partial [Anaerolineae bacterium]|nr:PrsW family intramembrane metalloprotease [Anaerolineae bacterium]